MNHCTSTFKSAHSFYIFWVFTEETGNNHSRLCTTQNKMGFASTRLHIQIRGNPMGDHQITVNTGEPSKSQTIWLPLREIRVYGTAGDPTSELCNY